MADEGLRPEIVAGVLVVGFVLLTGGMYAISSGGFGPPVGGDAPVGGSSGETTGAETTTGGTTTTGTSATSATTSTMSSAVKARPMAAK